jgi:hypothetical protein
MATDLTAADLALFSAEKIAFHEKMRLLGYFGTPVNAVNAAGTLTIGAIGTAGDTFTIGNKVFTCVANGTANENGEVNIGTDKATFQTAVKAAINGTDGYNVAHTQVVCGTISGDNYPITAIVAGIAGNSIVTTETFTSGSNVFGAATLGSGVNGTIGIHGQPMVDATYLYVCSADNGVADKNWRRVALGSAY